MSTQIAYADGNLTGSTTFKAAETGTSALAMVRANTTTLASNANVSSPSFTITNAKVIEGVMLFLMANQAAPAGTLLVELQKSGTTQASVTVNTADLPHSATGTNDVLAVVPCFFKFSSTATGDGATGWTVKLTLNNTSGNGITYSRNSATAGDMTRALRTSTAGAPSAADDLYILGELTGQGTHNARAVTMDSTATTAYGSGTVNSTSANGGGIRIACYGTLAYGTTGSTAYNLRVNGDVEVMWNGTLDIGSSGSEIPRSSAAVLELQMASANLDFGLLVRNLGVLNIAGLSRTSGKNVAKCKLTADLAGATVLTSGPSATNATNTLLGSQDPTGVSLLASSVVDTTTNATHSLAWSAPSITNTTQTAQVWLARGSGTNNRFVRFCVGNATNFASVTNGFYVDVDLSAGTVGTPTAVGTGAATSASITAVGAGYVVTLTGKVASGAATPSVLINICSASGTTSFAGANNQALIYEGVQLVTASSISTTFSVDTDTGWLSGDKVCIAATMRTPGDSEDFVLSADAGSTSFASALYPFGYGGPTTSIAGTHSGTSPTQAEIGLLTRNVKIRSVSSSLWGYVQAEPLATVSASWAEFYYLGANTVNKYGLALFGGAVTNAKSVAHCALHDMYVGCYVVGGGLTSAGVTLSSNVVWNTTSIGIDISSTIADGDYSLDGNLAIKTGSYGYFLNDGASGTITNNVSASFTTYGFNVSSGLTGAVAIGTFQNNTAHSGAGTGMLFSPSISYGTIDGWTAYRNSTAGIQCGTGSMSDALFTNLTLFGNGNGILFDNDVLNISTGVICGDSSFAQASGILITGTLAMRMNLASIDFSPGTGIYVANSTADINFSISNWRVLVEAFLNDCHNGTTPLTGNGSTKASWSSGSFVAYQAYNQTAGDHRFETLYGQLKTDTSIFKTASPSMRMTPNVTPATPVAWTLLAQTTQYGAGPSTAIDTTDADLITITSAGDQSAPFPSFTDSEGNSFTNALSFDNGNGRMSGAIYVCQNPVQSASHTFTKSSSADGSFQVQAWKGSSGGANIVDQTIHASFVGGTGQTDFQPGSITPTEGNELLLVYLGLDDPADTGSPQFSADSGFTVLDASDVVPASNYGGVGAYLVQTSPAAINPTITRSNALGSGKSVVMLMLSLRGAPQTSGAGRLESASKGRGIQKKATNGAATSISVWVRTSTVGDGAAYNGDAPRLIQRANAALGVTNDVVLATSAGSAGTWTQLTATSSVPTDDGVWEFVVDCDGTAGWVNVDDWT